MSTVRVSTDCVLCPVKNCVARSGGAQITGWAEILGPRIALMPGAPTLFNAGERQEAVYVVRGGCIKTYTVDDAGERYIRGFFLPGELIGLDGLGKGIHLSTAAAVKPSQVCVVPVDKLMSLMQARPRLAKGLLEQASSDLAHALSLSGDFSAERRLAAFLLDMRDRLDAGILLRLPMPQRDIGSYLRLATETVCRTIKSFERRGWLNLRGRTIRLLNEPELAVMAGVGGGCELAQAV